MCFKVLIFRMSTPATTRKPTTTKSTTRRPTTTPTTTKSTTRRWGLVPINVSLPTAGPKIFFKEFLERLDDILQNCFKLKIFISTSHLTRNLHSKS